MKQTPTRKLAQWFKENVDVERTSKTEAQRIREAKMRGLVDSRRFTEENAKVIVSRAWRQAGFPSMHEYRWVPQEITIAERGTGEGIADVTEEIAAGLFR